MVDDAGDGGSPVGSNDTGMDEPVDQPGDERNKANHAGDKPSVNTGSASKTSNSAGSGTTAADAAWDAPASVLDPSEDDADPSLEGIVGAESGDDDLPRPPLKPETPELENVVFVLVGVVFSVLVIWRLITIV